MSYFVLDPSGCREIGLCPHLQIYPITEMPQITKLTNTLCKHCQQGKKTKTRFKSKEYSTTKPLEIVHADLVGPTTTKFLKYERYFMLLVDDCTRMTAV
jgi:hypothetical protein